MTVLAAAIPAAAQFRRKREPHKLRAIAALVWPSAAKSAPTLEPLVIFANGRYFDASVYLASPVPLAAQPGVVYEAQKSGAGVGLFTVSVARQVNDSWLAQGTWHEGLEAPRPVMAGKSRRAPVEESDERPILHKSGSSKPSQPPGNPAPAGNPAPDKTAPSQPSQTAKTAPASAPPPQSESEDESGRPVLRRGKPAQAPSEDIPAEIAKATKSTPVPPASPGKTPQPVTPAPKIMLAVSDAQPSQDERSFLLNWTAQEESQLTSKAVALAQQEIAKWAQFRQQKRGEWPLEDVQVKFFDLLLDNYPEVVLTGRQPAGAAPAKSASRRVRGASQKTAAAETPAEAAPDVYVTLVARGDLDGNLRTLFSNITDARHLDVSPRLELLDAVDADGEGYGELLFHKVWGGSTPLEGNVVLYRVGPDNLVELFDASPPQ